MGVLIPKTDPEMVKEFGALGIPLVNPQKAIAARIRDKNHLREFIQALAGENRLKVYEALVPHLSFMAPPFWWLMAKKGKRRGQQS